MDQAGGHIGSLIPRGDKILKRVGKAELEFYNYLFSPELQDPDMLEFRKFVPTFYGVEQIEGHSFAIIENLLDGYNIPSILDCKVGKVTWTPHHDPAKTKRQQDEALRTTTSTLGFRICGVVAKDQFGTIFGHTGKFSKGEEPTADNVHEHFRRIVTRGERVQMEIIDQFIRDTQEILDWFKKQRSKHFYTCSVFYVAGLEKAQTRFIDFAHVFDAEGQPNTNVIEGLESLIMIWNRVKSQVLAESQPLAQAAGHEGSLIPRGDKLLKRVKAPEITFYDYLFSPTLENPEMIEFRKFVPYYFGVEKLNGHDHIVIENLLYGYTHPSILDCKIGKVTWLPENSDVKTKKQQEVAMRSTQATLGFRICGILCKDEQGNVTGHTGKYSRNTEPVDNNVHEEFRRVVTRGDRVQLEFIDQFIRDTQELLDWFIRQRTKHFFTCSVFYVAGLEKAQTRFIDFAHVFDSDGTANANVIEGLESLIMVWNRVKAQVLSEGRHK
mmetsp:Transcript_14184/g.14254  ORF Transcript_14184/g.14254 Transcript_14184/m.14254 type:complete len:496 (+) Transcript_14184:16-1503(+)